MKRSGIVCASAVTIEEGKLLTDLLELRERTNFTHSQLAERRRQGHVPAVLYGADAGGISVEVGEREIAEALRRNPNAVFEVSLAGRGRRSVLVREVQRSVLSGKLMHVDFFQINVNESIDAKITIHLVGDPVGVKHGGVLQVEIHEVDARCMADRLPPSFEVDISGMDIGEQLLVSDLPAYEGVEVTTDHSALLATILTGTVRVDEVEPAPTEE